MTLFLPAPQQFPLPEEIPIPALQSSLHSWSDICLFHPHSRCNNPQSFEADTIGIFPQTRQWLHRWSATSPGNRRYCHRFYGIEDAICPGIRLDQPTHFQVLPTHRVFSVVASKPVRNISTMISKSTFRFFTHMDKSLQYYSRIRT